MIPFPKCEDRRSILPIAGRRLKTIVEKLEYYSVPEPCHGCYLWHGSINDWGYGLIWWEGAFRQAHRMAWTVAYGDIPDGQRVLHRCDMPPCVNPDHLFLGSDADNVADKMRKGRHKFEKGEERYNSKLTDEIVREIRRSRLPAKFLVKQFGVSKTQIHRVKRREVWVHVLDEVIPDSACGEDL